MIRSIIILVIVTAYMIADRIRLPLSLITITYLKLLNKCDGRTGKIGQRGLDGVDRA